MDETNVNRIVFWGPQSSGKTWLLNAFLKKIEILNRKIKPLGHSLVMQRQVEGKWVDIGHIESVNEGPTPGMKEIYYRLLRGRTENGVLPQVNNQCHEILVVDNAGGLFEKGNRGKVDQNTVAMAMEKVKNARYLILALNSGMKENTVDGAIVENLNELSEYINDSSKGKFIAACLTKVDTLAEELVVELYNRDKSELRSLLIRSFGEKYVDRIYDALQALRCDEKNQVELFATSAIGYYYLNGRKTPNITQNANGAEVADPAHWYPEEVEHPFFWLIDIIERKRLSFLPKEKSIFQIMMGSKTITETRTAENVYMPYEQLIRLAKSR
jgi:GTPase SAR1 family protein